jgi:purine/pyrimidine-nucleoside phosphorylase
MLKVNEYFDGKVKSISLQTATLPATVGVMVQGEYEFSTGAKETMTVISGELAVLYPNETEWQAYVEGQSFDVAANSSFKVKAVVESAYLCKFWR